MASTVVPHCAAMPLKVSPHWTVIYLAHADHANARPVEANELTKIAITIANWKTLLVMVLSLRYPGWYKHEHGRKRNPSIDSEHRILRKKSPVNGYLSNLPLLHQPFSRTFYWFTGHCQIVHLLE